METERTDELGTQGRKPHHCLERAWEWAKRGMGADPADEEIEPATFMLADMAEAMGGGIQFYRTLADTLFYGLVEREVELSGMGADIGPSVIQGAEQLARSIVLAARDRGQLHCVEDAKLVLAAGLKVVLDELGHPERQARVTVTAPSHDLLDLVDPDPQLSRDADLLRAVGTGLIRDGVRYHRALAGQLIFGLTKSELVRHERDTPQNFEARVAQAASAAQQLLELGRERGIIRGSEDGMLTAFYLGSCLLDHGTQAATPAPLGLDR